mgnify:CR=1 FL=1
MKEKLSKIQVEALEQINAPDANLEEIKIKYLGKKGELVNEIYEACKQMSESHTGALISFERKQPLRVAFFVKLIYDIQR